MEARDGREGRLLAASVGGFRAAYSIGTRSAHLLHAFRLGRSATLYAGYADERVFLGQGSAARLGRGLVVKLTCSFPAGAGR